MAKRVSITILFSHLFRYEQQDVALNSGMILRECLRYEPIASTVLRSPNFYKLFTYVEMSTFDVASDAFSTFKVIISFQVLRDGIELHRIFFCFFTCNSCN